MANPLQCGFFELDLILIIIFEEQQQQRVGGFLFLFLISWLPSL